MSYQLLVTSSWWLQNCFSLHSDHQGYKPLITYTNLIAKYNNEMNNYQVLKMSLLEENIFKFNLL